MDELKKQLNIVAEADETYSKITVIADKFGLMLDAQGELGAEIQDVIMGFKPSKDFVKNIQNRLEIDGDKAREIANEVSLQILEPIRDKLQQIQADAEKNAIKLETEPTIDPAKTISSIEKAGDFTVVKNPSSSSPQFKEENINRENVLTGIEDGHVPLVDHLLTTPINNQSQTETRIVPEIKETKTYTVDPYREQA